MLYVTTRNILDTYTARSAVYNNRATDGGAFVPYRLPEFSVEEISGLKSKEFCACVSEILNLFFAVRLDKLDIAFCVGKNPVKLVPMSHKIVVAEAWHNSEQTFDRILRNLNDRIQTEVSPEVSDWMKIAVRIAVLFAVYGQLLRDGCINENQTFDVALTTGDFTAAISAWYAKAMGLPVGKIVCGCTDNSCVWELLHHGEMRVSGDVPLNLERLIFAKLGVEKTLQYARACEKYSIYSLSEEEADVLSSGIFAAVVSKRRSDAVIQQIYKTNKYLLEPDGSVAYAGLQDYRARDGETRTALILSERGPICAATEIAAAMGISENEFRNLADSG